MKSISKLLPLLLIVLMVVSSYKIISTATEKNAQYDAYLQSARDYASKGIVVDAIKEYNSVLDMKTTPEVCLEIGKMYNDNEMGGDAVEWGEHLMDLFPDESFSYEYALESYIKYDNFEECYSIIETAKKRGVSSKKIDEIALSIEYKYELNNLRLEDASIYSGGLCAAKKDGQWGYLDESGMVSIGWKYFDINEFASGLAPVQEEENGEVFYIDLEGNKKLDIPDELNCKKAGLIIDNILPLSNGTKYSYYDTTFKKLFGSYDYASTMNMGVAAVKEGENWFLIDSTGAKLCDTAFKDVKLDEKEIVYRNERLFVKAFETYILVDSKGKQIGKHSFEDAMLFKEDAPAAVKINQKWGFIDKNGKVVIDPMYDDARSFVNGFAAVSKDGKWYYINLDGEAVIEGEFTACRDFNANGCAFVCIGDRWSLLKLYKNNQ